MRGELGSVFGVIVLNGLAVFGAPLVFFLSAAATGTPLFIFVAVAVAIFPGFYLACRLIACVPAALLENIGPRSSLERSFALTKGSAGRAFVVYLLYVVILYAAASIFAWPFAIGVAASQKDPAMLRTWLALTQVGSFAAQVLIAPVLTIATAVLYYDLRVRKEGFDLQFMLNPTGNIPSGRPIVPTMLS
jgi:hypothetical protein